MEKQNIIEIAMEIALPPKVLQDIEKKAGIYAAIRAAMSTSVGGIGPLLRDRIIAQSELGVNVIGISLIYDSVWIQRWQAWGQFYLESGKSADYIRPFLKKLDQQITVKMFSGEQVEITVWEAEYGNAKTYFLDAPNIGNIVYPGPEDAPIEAEDAQKWADNARARQSWVLGRGGLELLKLLKIEPNVIVLSETPTVFGYHDLVEDKISKEKIFENTKYVFNDHTPLEYAHPKWPEKFAKELKIKPKHYKDLESYKQDPEKIDVTQLIINAVNGVYGVAKIHGEVMRKMPALVPYAKKIKTITNGVSRDIWQAEVFKNYEILDNKKLLNSKQKEKKKLTDWIWQRYKLSSEYRQIWKNRPLVMWMRRVTSYKRLDILKEIIERDDLRDRLINLNLTIFLGGRIHQADAHSGWVVFELLDMIQKYPQLEDRLVLLDNFNVWEASRIFKGVDAAIMISNKGREASATGFMKAQMNGAVIIATNDGAIPESVFFHNKISKDVKPNGFLVEYQNNQPTAEGLLKALEEFKVVYDNKKQRVNMIRAALEQTGQVDVIRTAKEMLALYKRL